MLTNSDHLGTSNRIINTFGFPFDGQFENLLSSSYLEEKKHYFINHSKGVNKVGVNKNNGLTA